MRFQFTKIQKEQLKEQIADIKANCDLAIEGRDIKIKELETENAKLKSVAEFQQSSNMKRHFEIQKLEKENAELKDHLAEEVELHLHAEDYIKSLEQQIEKMKCCGNCRFDYCERSSECIDKDGNRTFHCWNEEKEKYCDVGKNGKYQCWEIEK